MLSLAAKKRARAWSRIPFSSDQILLNRLPQTITRHAAVARMAATTPFAGNAVVGDPTTRGGAIDLNAI
jgi:hypothetical protein